MTDEELCYRAVQARDARFDGWFYVAVTSTGIYCRPSCASVTPRRENARFFLAAAAAQRGGFRACKRCRPDASPGSPEWNRRGDVVARAMKAIGDGLVDREGVAGLARHLGYSERQLNRLVTAELGAGPLEIARAQRAQTARILLETTPLAVSEVAFAAGFSSVRQFNDTVRAIFGEPPTALRARAGRRGTGASAGGAIELRLAFRAPLAAAELFSFLRARAVPGLESASAGGYARVLSLPHGAGLASLREPLGDETWLPARLVLEDLRDLTTAVQRLRQLFDLDADPGAVLEVLGNDPVIGEAVRKEPGRRVPGSVEAAELSFRAILGQQVSVAGARTLAARLVARYGEPLPPRLAGDEGGLSRRFPSAEALAGVDPSRLGMPRSRGLGLVALADALSSGHLVLGPGADRGEVRARLLSLPGIGPWTAGYIAMRALADPDAFLPSDLGVKRALEACGRSGEPAAALRLSEPWRPYRAYGLMHLWFAEAASLGALDKEKVA